MARITRGLVLAALDQYDYDAFGLRVVWEDPPGDGDMLGPSRVWIDGDPTDEYLRGVSAIEVTPRKIDRALELITGYLGKHVILVGANSFEYGEDEGEIVLIDAQVLEVWTRETK
jgi:hypothetical protein